MSCRMLYEGLLANEFAITKVGWLCPSETRDSQCLAYQPEVREYLKRNLLASIAKKDKFIFAPCLQGYVFLFCFLLINNCTHFILIEIYL